jgi:hypothetical protein
MSTFFFDFNLVILSSLYTRGGQSGKDGELSRATTDYYISGEYCSPPHKRGLDITHGDGDKLVVFWEDRMTEGGARPPVAFDISVLSILYTTYEHTKQSPYFE